MQYAVAEGFRDRKADALRWLVATHAGAALWAQVDHELVDRAAWLPLVNEQQTDFVSARVESFQHHPYWDVLADQFVVK